MFYMIIKKKLNIMNRMIMLYMMDDNLSWPCLF